MAIRFEIEYVFKNSAKKTADLVGRLMTDPNEFNPTGKSRLDGKEISKITMIRSVSSNGKPRFDRFAIKLKKGTERNGFEIGQIAKLTEKS